MQLSQASCKKCGAAMAAPSIPPAPARRRSPAAVRSVEVEEDSPYQPPAAPAAISARSVTAGGEDSVFDRDRFLMRQRVFTIHEKYEIWDEEGRPILFVERPGHYLQNLGAIFAGLAAGGLATVPFLWLGDRIQSAAPMVLAVVAAAVAFVLVLGLLSKKRHIHFYRDDSRGELLLEVLQDQKLAFLTHTYTVNEPGGRTLARLSKNLLTDIFRKKWNVWTPDGRPLWEAKEDSVLMALVRRFLTRLVPLCFIFCLPGGQVVGEFNRKFTLLDRYVLDLSQDSGRALDRRVAIAMGVMLDTGERR
jgi:uncharacterized protein YxjI